MPKEKTSSILAGIAGEYFVAGELSRRGWIASLTLRNTRGVDILAKHEGTNRSVGVQVKTSSGRNPKWILNKKAETMTDPTVFYAFVRLMNGDTPRIHIVPSAVVAEHTERTHREWLGQTSKSGKPHKDSAIHNFRDTDEQYLDDWDALLE